MKLSTCSMTALLAILISATVVTGQTVRADFTGLPTDHPTVHIVEDSGKETKGKLLRFDAISLTLDVNKTEMHFDRQQVDQIYVRGDSLTNGMLTGLFAGVGVGIVGGLTADECGGFIFSDSTRSCTGSEKAGIAGILSAVFGGIGLGIGAGIDALIPGRDVLYQRRGPAGAGLSVAPVANRHGAGVSVAWRW